MIICDFCESRNPCKMVNLTINSSTPDNNSRASYDVCENCHKFISPIAFRIGVLDLVSRTKEEEAKNKPHGVVLKNLYNDKLMAEGIKTFQYDDTGK